MIFSKFFKCTPTKHQTLIHFIKNSNENDVCYYYNDPYFSNLKKNVLQFYINELASEGYLKPMIRHVQLTPKAFLYPHERRKALLQQLLLIFGKPIAYLCAWALGILSHIFIEIILRSL